MTLTPILHSPFLIAERWFTAISSLFQYPFRQKDSEQAKILWLVKVRWLALGILVFFASLGYAAGLVPFTTFKACTGVIGIVILFNLIVQLHYQSKTLPVPQVILCFHMAFDLGILTLILYLTHGIENPFIALYLFHACLGGLLIPGYLTLPFLALVHTALLFLQLDYISHLIEAPTSHSLQLAMIVFQLMVFGFWVVMRSLGHSFEQQAQSQVRLRILSETQDRLRAIGALTAGFSHEFASPLTTAKVRLQRASKKNPSEEISEALAAIDACEKVLHQMNDSQLDSRTFVPQPISIHHLLLEVIESWHQVNPNAILETKVNDVGTHLIPPVNFSQVILNLMDNAYRESPTTPITIELVKLDGQLHLSIQDQGPGFPDLVLKKLGEPFVTTKPEGTGLGLYVTSVFIQSLGGDLKVTSGPKNKGATVKLSWPLWDE